MDKDERRTIDEKLRSIVAGMPDCPGSYQFYDDSNTIIYVGKAKSLKKRVGSYFRKDVDSRKTRVLVSKIRDISYTVVRTEADALLLENSLIKKYSPRYNVLLKDDKTYPSICVTNEYLPRIIKTRRIDRKVGTYFGPYGNVGVVNAMLSLIKKVYKPRSCKLSISAEGIARGQYKPCLEYHIKNCLGPCIGRQSVDDYRAAIAQAKEILKGNTRELSRKVRSEMIHKAEELRFEEAEMLKQRYNLIENFLAKSEVVSHNLTNIDVFSASDDSASGIVFINFMHVKDGAINQSFTFEYKRRLDETVGEVLNSAMTEIRERMGSRATEIVVPYVMEWPVDGAAYVVPQRGEKRRLLELSEMNCRQHKLDRLKQAEKLNPEQRQTRLMKELQKVLALKRLPYNIECFDNSHLSGTDAVAACVVFKALKPSKGDYRKYNIRTAAGQDDYDSMREVVRRRYSRFASDAAGHVGGAMVEGADTTPLPDLIITDGGRGQMEAVRQVVEDELHLDIAIAGLAKDSRHRTRELLFGFPPQTIGMKVDSDLFRILTQIQDEVHRFAITFHRDKRSRRALNSELDDIKGVGPKTKDALLKHFTTVRRIKETSMESLSSVVGQSKAKIVFDYFESKKKHNGD